MKKILIFVSFVISIFVIGLVSLNSHSVQDRILDIGLKNILSRLWKHGQPYSIPSAMAKC